MNKYEDLFLDGYKLVCEEFRGLHRRRKELEAEYQKARKDLLSQAGGERLENGVKVTLKRRPGAVNLKGMLEDGHIDEDMIEHYRKPGVEFFEVGTY